MQFFVNPDKNPCQIRREVLTKALQQICQDALQDVEVFANKPNGNLFVFRKLLCTVLVTGENSAKLQWNLPVFSEYQEALANVEEGFKAVLLNQGLSCS